MTEELALLEGEFESIPRDLEWIRMDGYVPAMSCEVLLVDADGREHAFHWEGHHVSAAVHAALEAHPEATVVSVRRIVKEVAP